MTMYITQPAKIPIKHVIDSGSWFHCITGYVKPFNTSVFRLKIISFEKIELSEIDNPEEIDNTQFNLEEGDFWIMKLQLVNLIKEETTAIPNHILLFDHDGFKFRSVSDDHVSCDSNYARKSGLANIFGRSFYPKIKKDGAITFFLPKEETSYSLSVEGGKIKEV